MIIFVNKKNEIKDVGVTKDKTLTELFIDDTDNPFKAWSTAKICCYKATVIGGKVTMMTPYVDSRIIEHIENLGQQTETNAVDIMSTQEAVCESAITTEEKFSEVETALCESAIVVEEKIATVEESADARLLEIETALCELAGALLGEEE